MRIRFLLLISVLLTTCTKKQTIPKKFGNNVFYERAFEYRENNKIDSAFKYFDKAKEVFLLQDDSLGVAKCLSNMGYICTLRSDYYGAQDFSLQALDYFNKKIDSQYLHINANYNNLGKATYQIKDYKNSLKFYDSAIVYSKNSADTRIILNNKAKIYQEINDYNNALKIYNQVLKDTKIGSKEYAMSLTNLSLAKWLKDINYNALPNYLIALRIREKENDLWGINSSYTHIAEYYSRKNPDSALIYAKKAYQIALKINSANDQLYALKLLISLSKPADTKKYFEIYSLLDEQVQTVVNLDKNKFALVRYNFDKSRAENLVLQKDNANKKYQIIKREIIIFGTLIFISFLALFALFWYKKRKTKIELETQNKIRESQLKTSKRVHDVVANGLYRVMAEIENHDVINKVSVLDKIEELYEKSRDISYEQEPFLSTNFNQKITRLIQSFATSATKISLVGNEPELWLKVDDKIKFEIEQVLQELLVNMKKHSQANNVVVRFETHEAKLYVYYIDNGVGIAGEPEFKNGLTNTGNRINSINGEITFDTKVEKGLRINIFIPLF